MYLYLEKGKMRLFLILIICLLVRIPTTAQENTVGETNVESLHWQVILDGLNSDAEIIAFEDGFAFNGEFFEGDVDWYFYNPIEQAWSELDNADIPSLIIDITDKPSEYDEIKRLLPYGVTEFQIINDEKKAIYVDEGIHLIDLISNRVTKIDSYFDSARCQRLLEYNRRLVWDFPEDNLFVRCHQVFWFEDLGVESEWLDEFFNFDQNTYPRLRSVSPDGRYWVIHVTYQAARPIILVLDIQMNTNVVLGYTFNLGHFTRNYSDQIVWIDDETVLVALGDRILKHNASTSETSEYLYDELREVAQHPSSFQQLLSLDSQWLLVNNRGKVMIRNLSDIYSD